MISLSFRKFLILNKRFLKNRVFVGLLLLIPFCLFFSKSTTEKNKTSLNISVYIPADATEYTLETANLLFNHNGLINFLREDTFENLLSNINSDFCLAGIVFPSDIEILFSSFENGNPKNKIGFYVKSETVITQLLREETFALIYKNLARKILENYIASTDEKILQSQNNIDFINLCYEFYFTDEPLFLTYEDNQITHTSAQSLYDSTFPVRGMFSIFIFLIGLAASFFYFSDSENSLLLCFSNIPNSLFRFIYIILPVFDAGVIMFFSLRFSPSFTSWTNEFLLIIPFLLSVGSFCSFICSLSKDKIILSSVFPFVTIASLILCPIFINTKNFIQSFLPSYFYLSAVNSSSPINRIGLYVYPFAMFFLSVLADILKNKKACSKMKHA